MSIIDQQRDLESFSDQMLAGEAQRPTGRYPQFLVITEMQRRKDLRQRMQAQQYEQQPTVAEKLMQETGSLGGPGIAALQAGAGPNLMPGGPGMGAQSGGPPMQAFAGGGMIEGYGHGGGHSSGIKRLKMSGYQAGGYTGDGPRGGGYFSGIGDLIRAMQWRSQQIAAGERERELESQRVAQAMWGAPQVQAGIATPTRDMARVVGDDGQVRYVSPDDEPAKKMMMGRSPSELYGGTPRRMSRPSMPEMGGVREALPDFRESYESYVDSLFGPGVDIEALLSERRDVTGKRLSQIEGLASEEVEGLRRLAGFLSEQVREDPGEIESMIAEMRMSPEEMKKERIALALSGLGASIGSATNRGDIPAAIGGLTRESLARKDQQREADQRLALMGAEAAEARRSENIALRTKALEAEGMAPRIAREVAGQALAIEDGLLASAERLRQSAVDRQTTIGSLKSQFAATMLQVEAAADAANRLDPGKVSAALTSLGQVVMRMMEMGDPEDPELAELMQAYRAMARRLMENANVEVSPAGAGQGQWEMGSVR